MSVKIKHSVIKVRSKSFCEFIDLTEQVQKFVNKSRIKNGFVTVHSKHTTLAIRINEKEKGIVKDFTRLMQKIIPRDDYYHHNDLNIRTENVVCEPGASDCLNGHSHCAHLLMATSESLPIINGRLLLGQWQRIFAIELDVPRKREVFLQVLGEQKGV